ncbi:hypothetical protein QR680_000992 [Steinernema hermaphroditum]|uniref:ribonuclease H n=1 Tax=Steinernema hermaphroditum TaxID=289476 RepID=A0AA39GWK8_9BILA|nr:hypothetical protein QR680_000992 [Steinernema hermaphroditum]
MSKFRSAPASYEGAPVAYTDSACFRNGRRNARAGYGVYWDDNYFGLDDVSERLHGRATNQRAELMAVHNAIQQAIDYGYPRMIIRTDSTYVVNSLVFWIRNWRHNDWINDNGNPVSNQSLIRDIDNLLDDIWVWFEHVCAHSGDHGNEEADRLANKGANGC